MLPPPPGPFRRGTRSAPGTDWGLAERHAHSDSRWLVEGSPVRYLDSGQSRDATKFELYAEAVLTCDRPEPRLRRGDVVKLVIINVSSHKAPEVNGQGNPDQVNRSAEWAYADSYPLLLNQ